MGSGISIGLALGAGGARGMAHILVCEVFDELGVKPDVIAGTSIGAIIGAVWSWGMSGRDMRERGCAFYAKRREVLARLWRSRPRAVAELVRTRSLSAQFDAELILEKFVPDFSALPETFEELSIPLKVIACDFYGWREAILSTGALKPAIAASIAIPAIFRTVLIGGRVHVDGGACNPLPFDRVGDKDLVVACDVTGGPVGDPMRHPRMLECAIGSAQISMQSIIAEKLRTRQPDILVRPEVYGIFVLDFLKTQTILDMNIAFKDDLKRRLDRAIGANTDRPALTAVR